MRRAMLAGIMLSAVLALATLVPVASADQVLNENLPLSTAFLNPWVAT